MKPLTDFLTAKNRAEAGMAGVFTSTTAFAPPSGMSLRVTGRAVKRRNYRVRIQIEGAMEFIDGRPEGIVLSREKRVREGAA